MTAEANAVIRELEEQRSFAFARCAQFAARIAALEVVNAAKEQEAADLRRHIASLQQEMADKEAVKAVEGNDA